MNSVILPQTHKRGSALVYVLVFGVVSASVLVTGIASFALFEHRAARQQETGEASLHIAESGLDFYDWFLSQHPTDFTAGLGATSSNALVYDVRDDAGAVYGQYELEIVPPAQEGGNLVVFSTGYTLDNPNLHKVVKGTFQPRSGLAFTVLSNEPLTLYEDTSISGPIKSNTGIEFHGTTDATIEAARATYIHEVHGEKPGVWGTGGPTSFFNYPSPIEDFDAYTVDLAELKEAAIASGIYLPKSNNEGYKYIFNPGEVEDTVEIYDVTGVCFQETYWVYFIPSEPCTTELIETLTVPANAVIYADDTVWLSGDIPGQTTIAAGELPDAPGNHASIFLMGSTRPHDPDDGDVLGLIAQGDIFLTYTIWESEVVIEAAMAAQKGSIGRPPYVDAEWSSLAILDQIRTNGSQIAARGIAWRYGDPIISGFASSSHVYSSVIRDNPPPGFPAGTSYRLTSFEIVQ